jgi:hypothetical protein
MKNNSVLYVSGVVTLACSILFILIVLILGLVQPGYNHFIDTISVLVLGKWGWIQKINFLILALGLSAVGTGLSILLYRKKYSFVSFSFYAFSIVVFFLMIFSADPVDRTKVKLIQMNSVEGFIHITLTMILIALTAPLTRIIATKMKKNTDLKRYARYTLAVFAINIIFGSLWFICRRLGILFAWKGVWQKMLALNVLTWMFVMGSRFVFCAQKAEHYLSERRTQ